MATETSEKYSKLVQGQQYLTIPEFELESGRILKECRIAYKTWGSLNSTGDNCMVICHALSGSSDVEDWWEPLIGKNKTFDSNKYFIFCGNVLGSPYGSSSPCTINPDTGERYGPTFPQTTIRDDVNAHKLVLNMLGVVSIKFVIGGSMGGMQTLEWAYFGTDYVRNIVPIATSGRHSAWCISWGETQRQSIYSDPKYKNGYYDPTDPPSSGLVAARMAAMLTYRSRDSFETRSHFLNRFGRKVMPSKLVDPTAGSLEIFAHNEGNKYGTTGKMSSEATLATETDELSIYSAQSYLRYQGDKFIDRFDANCYIAITRKLDTHDVSRGRGTFEQALALIQQPCLVIGIASDGLFTANEQRELANGIPNSELVIIDSGEGHDGFLVEFKQMREILSTFIREKATEMYNDEPDKVEPELVKKNSLFGEQEDFLMW